MDIAIAAARTTTQQSNTVRSMVPMQLREGAESFIGFLEDYYAYLNTDGLPSQEIENIVSEHDIDRTSSQYIDRIQKEIAQNIPNSVAFDRVSLYKKIYHYYLTKGSEDSIINFFKIFYDEKISVSYPRNKLFKTSASTWDADGGVALDTKGFLSNADVLQDSRFWQDFSYIINTSLPIANWKTEYRATVHPAGFEFFAALVLLLYQNNKWIGRFIQFNPQSRRYEYNRLPDNFHNTPYQTRELDDHEWLKSLTPPSNSHEYGYDNQTGVHFPRFQYGLLPAAWTFFQWMPYEIINLNDFVDSSVTSNYGLVDIFVHRTSEDS